MQRRRIALIVLLSMIGSPAWAQQVWPILAKAGVAGAWSANCSAAASPSNSYIVFSEQAGKAKRVLDRGPSMPALGGWVDSANPLGPGTIMLRVRYDDPNWGEGNGSVLDTTVEIGPGRMRTLASTRLQDGRQFIKDGLFTGNGQPVPTLTRCR